jgi:hypothetical protein
MQIKHTFFFTLILGLLWTVYAFAYSTGPDPGENGLFGQDCTSCHSSFRVNSGSGTISLTGLPASWTAGQIYALTVTVPKPSGSRIYGFQLSAVADSTNKQAGSLARGPNVQIVCGNGAGTPVYPGMNCGSSGAIQFAEHISAGTSNTFTVNWTAPSSASLGTVRFNVAANAGNGDGTDFGDFIYTSVVRVAAASAPPPPDLSTHAFMVVDRGGISVITDGSGAQTAGYSSISPDVGSSTPTGVAIFGFRNSSNILVSETGVPATPLLTQGRIYAEVAGPLDTGLAIANPNPSPATISFSFTNAAGASAGSGIITIPANGQIAQFLDQPPLKVYSGTTFQGTFNFSSPGVPVGVVALRGLTNERGDFLMSTLPVIDTAAIPGTGPVVIPHFADGGGWMTQIFLVNPTSGAISGTVRFNDANGAATKVTIGGVTNSNFSYAIPAGSSQKLATAGTAGTTASGSVAVVPGGAGTTPVPLVVFSYKPAAVTVSEAGVPVASATAFRSYVESSGAAGRPGSIATGVAVANTSSAATTVTFDMTDLKGASVGVSPVSINLPASGQTARFLADIFTSLPSPLKGVLRITTTGSGISVVGLRTRTNERSDFLITTTPPSNEAESPATGDLLFPHLVNGGGYTTQFILFSGTAGQTASGDLHFFTQDGSPLSLTVN